MGTQNKKCESDLTTLRVREEGDWIDRIARVWHLVLRGRFHNREKQERACSDERTIATQRIHNEGTTMKNFRQLDATTIYVENTPQLVVFPDRPEPPRIDPKADRVLVSDYLREQGWTLSQLTHLTARFGHPKPIGITETKESVHSRSAIATWRSQFVDELRSFGFVVK